MQIEMNPACPVDSVVIEPHSTAHITVLCVTNDMSVGGNVLVNSKKLVYCKMQ